MGSLLQDIRYGLRMLARNPAFSAIAVLTLALGIGANTAIFSLTDQILLRRLPVQNPEQLVALRTTGSNQGHVWSDSTDDSGMFSYPVYKDLRDHNPTFSNLLARFPTSVSVSGQGSTELAQAELVSGNYFEMLGVQPALGRVFSTTDETAPGANTLAVLSYGDRGDMAMRPTGALVADRPGVSVAYALWGIQERGEMFVGPGIEVYEGMILGENAREDDMNVNVTKEKKQTNMRSSSADEAIRLIPPREMTLEKAIEFIADDEFVEVTPKSIRLRKKVLDAKRRPKRWQEIKASAEAAS